MSTSEEMQELVRLMAKTPPRRKYVLVQRASGELAFVQDEIEIMLRRAIAAAFGEPRPRRRIIRLDEPPHKARSQG
jgi:RNase P/RNase MRP subunit POP5